MRRFLVLALLAFACGGAAAQSKIGHFNSEAIMQALPEAIDALRPGGVIHFYEIMEEEDLDSEFGKISDAAVRKGKVMKELGRRKVKSYSPTMGFYAFDLSFL